jgi:hypothetical protein
VEAARRSKLLQSMGVTILTGSHEGTIVLSVLTHRRLRAIQLELGAGQHLGLHDLLHHRPCSGGLTGPAASRAEDAMRPGPTITAYATRRRQPTPSDCTSSIQSRTDSRIRCDPGAPDVRHLRPSASSLAGTDRFARCAMSLSTRGRRCWEFECATEYVSLERERGRGCTGRKRPGMTST